MDRLNHIKFESSVWQNEKEEKWRLEKMSYKCSATDK